MKDIVFTKAAQKREFFIWLACFVVANIVNVVSIIKFQTPWYEIFTLVGYVVVTSLLIYGLVRRWAWARIYIGVLTVIANMQTDIKMRHKRTHSPHSKPQIIQG